MASGFLKIGEGFSFLPSLAGRRIKVEHALEVLSSLEKMRKRPTACDFTIKVGTKEFPVHRSILVACSDYFRAMFESFMKESIEGSVNLKDLDEDSVEVCIDFMYTGDESLVTVENAPEVLNTATMLQLEKLQELCFGKLMKNMSEQNCIPLLNLAHLYGHEALRKQAEKYFCDHFQSVVCNAEYQDLSKDEALMYIVEFGSNDNGIWTAATSWIEYDIEIRGEDTIEFFNMMSLEEFPEDSLINNLWNAKYFQESELCKEQLLKCVFSNVSRISEHISIRNWFTLNTMADCCDHVVQEIKDLICRFMLEHFTEILNNDKFVKLPRKDVIEMFRSPNTVYFSSEKLKWNAMLKWLKGNPDADASTFSKLLEGISLRCLPKKILLDITGDTFLTKKYPSSQKILEASIRQAPVPLEEDAIAVLYDTGTIDTYDMNEHKWCPAHFPANTSIQITSLNKHLCLLEGKNLYIYRNRKWVKQSSMSKAPHCDSKVISCQDMIFVVGKNFYSCFNAITNSWTEQLVLPPRFGDTAFSPVSGKNKIYLITYMFVAAVGPPANNLFEWLSIPNDKGSDIGETLQAVYCSGSIYLLGKRMLQVQPILLKCTISDKSWKTIVVPNIASFELFAIKNCLYACSTDSSNGLVLSEYNEKWDEWMEIKKKPKTKSALGSSSAIKRVKSVCAFRSKIPNRVGTTSS